MTSYVSLVIYKIYLYYFIPHIFRKKIQENYIYI